MHLLREQYGNWPLATAPLAHDGQLVLMCDNDRETWISVDKPGHDVINGTLINLKEIREALGRGGWVAIKTPRRHIEVDPDRHSGAPVIRGRRISTSFVSRLAAAPDGRDLLREDYDLSEDEIDDAIGYEEDLAQVAAAA